MKRFRSYPPWIAPLGALLLLSTFLAALALRGGDQITINADGPVILDKSVHMNGSAQV